MHSIAAHLCIVVQVAIGSLQSNSALGSAGLNGHNDGLSGQGNDTVGSSGRNSGTLLAVLCAHGESTADVAQHDLIAVQKGSRLINMDSQAPNIAAGEWLQSGALGKLENLKAESKHGDSRFDFSFTLDGRQCFLEVKGVTLENDGVCAFPDAPTERGAKHLRGLTQAANEGYGAYVLFVIQMADVKYLHPNDATDPNLGAALREAADNGVEVLAMDCEIAVDSMTIRKPVPVKL